MKLSRSQSWYGGEGRERKASKDGSQHGSAKNYPGGDEGGDRGEGGSDEVVSE